MSIGVFFIWEILSWSLNVVAVVIVVVVVVVVVAAATFFSSGVMKGIGMVSQSNLANIFSEIFFFEKSDFTTKDLEKI